MEWISVEDELPEEYERVLTWCECSENTCIDYITIDKYKKHYRWSCAMLYDTHSVHLWMRIPEAPKEELKCEVIDGWIPIPEKQKITT